MDNMVAAHGEKLVKGTLSCIESRNSVLWVAMSGNSEVVGTSMSRKGKFIPRWFIPIKDEDIIIYRNNIALKHRGRGICTAMMQNIIYMEIAHKNNAYVDCKIYNYSSIRSIEKAGFEKIATMRPIKE